MVESAASVRLHDAGIGGVRAMQLIQKHGSLEAVMAQLDTARYGVPDPFPFSEARVLFKGESITVSLFVVITWWIIMSGFSFVPSLLLTVCILVASKHEDVMLYLQTSVYGTAQS